MQQFQISIALNLTSEPFLPFVFPSCILVYRWWAVKFWPFLYRYCNFQPAPWAHIVPLFGILKSHDETFIWVAGCSTPSSGNVRTCESRRSWPLKVSLLSQKFFVYLPQSVEWVGARAWAVAPLPAPHVYSNWLHLIYIQTTLTTATTERKEGE